MHPYYNPVDDLVDGFVLKPRAFNLSGKGEVAIGLALKAWASEYG